MTSTTGARVLKIIMGLSFVLMGALFTGLLWHSYQRAERTRHWTAVDALVTSSQVMTNRPTPHSPLMYRAEIKYRYTLDGVGHTSHRVKQVEGDSNKKEVAEAKAKEYPVGKQVTCYVNPAEPGFAILEHATRAGLYSIWFPLLFVVGGLGIIWSAFREPRAPA